MAINKRKDAAALFELIDKSTLKVPKHAGALKIPSWWSSKTNPPASGEQGVAKSAEPVKEKAAEKAEREEKPQGLVQHKLFDPPPANAEVTVSPTIRPPAPPGRWRGIRRW